MRRIRLIFALLAVLLLVSRALLVQRTLRSLAVEREVRHRAVAERVFDEMERELSGVLRREEDRPFEHYRFYATLDESGGGHAARSPLSAPPEASYVVGYFQIDPDGSFHSPLVPRDLAAAAARGDWPGAPEIAGEVAALERIVDRGLRGAATRAAAESSVGRGDFAQAPGSTLDLLRKESAAGKAAQESAGPAESKAREKLDIYRVLSSLNRGVTSRDQRQAKLQPATPAAKRAPAPSLAFAEADAALDEPFFADDEKRRRKDERAPWLEIQPMVGRAVDGEHLLLYRAVLLGEGGYRQGLAVRVPVLTRQLAAGVLGAGELARHASLDFLPRPDEAPPAARDDALVYQHRFAEPFDDLAVRLTLAPLPDVAGAGSVYLIAVLLLVASSAGLLALYHMVTLTVRFAERRSNFAAAVSHELKTPLTAIRMHGEMLRDGMVDSEEKRQEYYATITAESERLTRLINNVLEFSRLEQGTREMNLRVGSIAPVVEEAARILTPHAQEVGFSISVELDDDLPPVRFDRDAVLQVVFNLVDNALKYARASGDRTIALRCAKTRQGVVLSVRDRGPGVPAKHLAQVFEPFYRGEKELTRSAKGTGIGLALVKGLAQHMDAVVAGRNPPEGGFEVSVTFRPLPAA